MDQIKDRIKALMDHQGMTQKVFAQLTGISEGSLSGVFNGRTKPTLAMVDSIHASLPKVSLSWLLYGSGPMVSDDQGAGDEATAPSPAPKDVNAPSLFDAPKASSAQGVRQTINNPAQLSINYVDKPERKITEIRIFYDDQTWESFVPKK